MVLAVVAWRGDLLGALLSNWLSAWRFGQKLGCDTQIVWRNSDENRVSPYSLYTLFDREGLDSIPSLRVQLLEPPSDIGPRRWQVPLEWASAQWINLDDVCMDDCASLPSDCLIDYYGTGIKYFPGDDRQAVRIELANLFHSLPLHAGIKAALSSIGDLIASPFAALHLRRGNLVDYLFHGVSFKGADVSTDRLAWHARSFVTRYAHLNSYVRALQQNAADDLPVIVFSDDLGLRAETFAKVNRPVLDIHSILDGLGLSALQRAFVEFIVISRAKYVMGAKSQFSILPAKIGNARYVDARRYAELPEIVDDLRPLILHAQGLDVGPRELGAVVFKEFSAMYERLNPELAGAFSRLGDEWL